jgi:tetratricopeptide (TPR) repeat protein
MTSESTPAPGGSDAPPANGGGSQLSPAERGRLQKCFQTGTQSAATNVDYAIEMFGACVLGDPGNAIYLQSLMAVLKRKYGSRRAGGLGSLWSAGSRVGLKKLAANAQWRDLLKQGVDILKANPGDTATLLAMADACGQLQFHETQRVYLKTALDATPSDPDVNRQCARFLANHGEFDQAIACWVRVSNAKGLAEEAQREIARLQVEKTIVAGHGLTGRSAAAGGRTQTPASATGETPVNRVAALREAIRQKPAEIEPYLELADLLEREGTADEAEKVLLDALAASGNDLKVREHLEDRQLRWSRHRVHIAEKRLEAEDNEATRSTLERLRSAQLKQEVEIYSARCQRYPENLTWKYELAMRLKAVGNHAEAIKQFQDLLQDVRRKGAVSLELGECFQKIKQYPLAMRNYQVAVETLTDRELDLRKRALYRAGVLAAGLQDVDAAQKYLSELAGLDFSYRDVAQRLDKLASAKDKGGA